jgi:thiol-disulfide isomerase/thioredoxin
MTLHRIHYGLGVYLALIMGLAGLNIAPTLAAQRTIKAGDTDIGVQVSPAKGNLLFIWQPHEVGLSPADQQLLHQLSAQGIETWQLDLLEDYFLPNTANNMDRIPPQAFAAVLDAASQTGKRVIVASSGRGAIPLLRGVRQWQLAHPNNTALLGTILISPKLFIETPDPGLTGKLMPIATATNQTLVVLQPDKSPWYWKLDQTLAGLQQGGSDVYVWPLHNLRDRFYFRPDASDAEKQAGDHLATRMRIAMQLLLNNAQVTRHAVALNQATPPAREGKKDHLLALYKGDPQPPALRLTSLQGKIIDLADLKGRVVLVNFWATWCPPCVHEMPSMQRLADHFQGQAFTILGVNMAEDTNTVTDFLQHRVKVDFPIVLDKDGQALKAWRVFAFPTSYVLDKQGRIRYALFGGLDWDTDAVKHKLAALLAE